MFCKFQRFLIIPQQLTQEGGKRRRHVAAALDHAVRGGADQRDPGPAGRRQSQLRAVRDCHEYADCPLEPPARALPAAQWPEAGPRFALGPRAVARPRQVAMYLAKQLTSRSLPEIGRKFGGRDHTTVMHAVKKVEELRSTDVGFNEDVELLRRMLEI